MPKLTIMWKLENNPERVWDRVTSVGVFGSFLLVKMDDGWNFVIPFEEISSWRIDPTSTKVGQRYVNQEPRE